MVDPAYLAVISAAALLTVTYVRYRPAPGRGLLIADAPALGRHYGEFLPWVRSCHISIPPGIL